MTAGIPTMSVQTEKLHELCVETACRYKIFTVILTAYVFGRKMRHLLWHLVQFMCYFHFIILSDSRIW